MALAQGVLYPGATGVTPRPGTLPGTESTTTTTSGRTWLLEPSVDALFTVTDNVDLTPTGRRTDFVTQLTPALRFAERGAHTRLQGTIQAPILLYARTGSENNDVRPQVDVSGIAELVERLFYIEAAANVSQQFLSAFGPRPNDLVSATANRYTAQSYRLSPYLRGEASNGLSYQLRDDNIWANQGNTSFAAENSFAAQNSYSNELTGTITQEARPFGWALDYDRSETKFTQDTPLRTQIGRARLLFRQDVTLEWTLSAGYEDNNYPDTTGGGVTYGGGVRWRPNGRTTVDANVEHRFFGASYRVIIDHRTPLTIWSLQASRDITTYPQQLAALAGGDNVNVLLNRLFSSRVTDPVERQTFVNQLIRDRGLPGVLSGPLALFTQQVTLQERVESRVGLIGARNSIVGSLYRQKSEAVGGTAADISDLLLAQSNNTQTGGNIVWTLKVTPLYTLSTSADYVRTVENGGNGDRARQIVLTSALSAPLSPLTKAMIGARWQRLYSNLGNDYRETAAFVGINHIFR